MFICSPLESSLPPPPLRHPKPFGLVSRVSGRRWEAFPRGCQELGDNRNGDKLCLVQWVLSDSDRKQTLHEDQEQGTFLASHYFQLRGFP